MGTTKQTTPMNRQEALVRLVRDVQSDIEDYGVLRVALSSQFESALLHDSQRLAELAGQITALVDALDERRLTRMAITRALSGQEQPRNLAAVLDLLAPSARAMLDDLWQQLEGLVRECKQLNVRNCEFIVEQNALMQRVLHGEESTYAER